MSNNPLVQSALPIVVFGAVGLSVVMSLIFLFSRSSSYDEIGDGGLSSGAGGLAPPAPDSPAGRAEQELEIRQMLSARNERLLGRGQPALDIEAEVARLLGPPRPGAHSAGLTEEVRQLVVARNERRMRQGLEPLDVNAEIERTLRELGA
ncbi:MAG TPA: hypothetical protein VNZ05_03365 [Solirubrobacteraceae bacterium]|jgi:hypothetical protein|nr:hypothetical protein [Solirubrobacteraceae bacterium]